MENTQKYNRQTRRRYNQMIVEDTKKRERLVKLFAQYSKSIERISLLQEYIDNGADRVPYTDPLGNVIPFMLRRAQIEFLQRCIQSKLLELNKGNNDVRTSEALSKMDSLIKESGK